MNNFTADPAISDALELYLDLGFDAIPLKPGEKNPIVRAWPNQPVNRLWRNVPDNVNIGLRAGGEVRAAFLDCDEKTRPGSVEAVQGWMASLGYPLGDYPLISTASLISRHIYVIFNGELPGNSQHLATDFAAGDFRHGTGSFVAAPPSKIIGCNAYRLIDGDFRQLPHLDLKDVMPILEKQECITSPKLKMSRKAMALLNGHGIESYVSRSNADAALIASLIDAYYPFETIRELFEVYPTSGKYSELKATKGNKAASHYLHQTYGEVFIWTQNHQSKARRTIEAVMDWAMSRPWTGRTGAVDCSVFMAHMEIAFRAGRLTWSAAVRDLALSAGLSSIATPARANDRLCAAGLIALETKAIGDCANKYRLALDLDKLKHSPRTLGVRKCLSLSTGHDAFRFKALGKSAEQILQVLQGESVKVDEIASRTGRGIRTIKRVLNQLKNFANPSTGELLPMVATDGDGSWRALPIDLDRIARILRTAGTGDRQRAQYAGERSAHQRSLLMGRITTTSNPPSGDDRKV